MGRAEAAGMRVLLACLSVVVSGWGCASTTVLGDETSATICGGDIGGKPTVLARGDDGVVGLLSIEEGLVLTTSRSVSLVDPCTGELTELTREDEIVSSTFANGFVYYVTTDEMHYSLWLHRLSISGGSVESLGEIGSSRIAGSDRGVFALQIDQDGGYHIVDVTEGPSEPSVSLAGADIQRSYSLRGAGPRGVYMRDAWDSGGPLPFLRWAYAEERPVPVTGSRGGQLLDVQADGLTMYGEFSDGWGIARLPLEGGERTWVVDADDMRSDTPLAVQGDGQTACWRDAMTGPRCLAAGRDVRVLDPTDARAGAMVLREALYWTREASGGFELVAAMP